MLVVCEKEDDLSVPEAFRGGNPLGSEGSLKEVRVAADEGGTVEDGRAEEEEDEEEEEEEGKRDSLPRSAEDVRAFVGCSAAAVVVGKSGRGVTSGAPNGLVGPSS